MAELMGRHAQFEEISVRREVLQMPPLNASEALLASLKASLKSKQCFVELRCYTLNVTSAPLFSTLATNMFWCFALFISVEHVECELFACYISVEHVEC